MYKKFVLSLIAYANDLTIFVDGDEQLRKAMGIITAFKDIAGLSVNVDKSEILEIKVKTAIGKHLFKIGCVWQLTWGEILALLYSEESQGAKISPHMLV